MKVSIGFVPMADGKPYQPTLGSGWRERKKPITVYKTKGMALNQASECAEVFIEVED